MLTLPSTSKETYNNPSQNVNSNTVRNDGVGAAPGNQVSENVIEDTYCDDPGNIDHNNDNNGSDSDSVIVLQGSTPAAQRNQSNHPTQLDSSEDFQESPLPRTPKRTPAKKATPRSYAKKPASGVAARKRELTSKESPQTRAPGAKKVIVTRSMTSSRGGNKDSSDGGGSARPAREFYNWRSTAWAQARSNRPQSSSASTVKHGRTTKPPPAKKAATNITTATQAAKASLDNDKQISANRSASCVKLTPTIKLTATGRSTANVHATSTTTKHTSSTKSTTTPTTSTESSRNATTKSTPTSKPSRPTTSTVSVKLTPTTKSTPSSKPSSKAAAKGSSTTKSSRGNSNSGVATPSQSKNTNKSQRRGTKRHLADEDGAEAQTDAASPRKKARSSEPGSPRNSTSEIALHTRGLSSELWSCYYSRTVGHCILVKLVGIR